MPGENTVRPRLRVATITLLTAALLAPAFVAPPEAEAATRSEKRMAKYINRARHKADVRKLKISKALTRIARKQARQMRDRGVIFHNTRLARSLARYRWRIAGENVGVGPTIKTLHRAFMASKGHRRNIERGSYRKVGVGIARRGSIEYVAVVFLG